MRAYGIHGKLLYIYIYVYAVALGNGFPTPNNGASHFLNFVHIKIIELFSAF
jgi:hypothetical protein